MSRSRKRRAAIALKESWLHTPPERTRDHRTRLAIRFPTATNAELAKLSRSPSKQ